MTDDRAPALDRPFRLGSEDLELRLGQFWRWLASDLLNNTTRGALAEFIVASALRCKMDAALWNAVDLITSDQLKVEVKSSAYVQSWRQHKPSSPRFSVRPAREWNPDTLAWSTEQCRRADVYVFALLATKNRTKIDPLDLLQWRFHVLATWCLNAHATKQHTIGLARLVQIGARECGYADLRETVLQTSLVEAQT